MKTGWWRARPLACDPDVADGSISEVRARQLGSPLYPYEQTSPAGAVRSEKCHSRIRAVQRMALQRTLLVQPHVLVTIAVIGAVHHDGDALDIGLPAGALAGVEDDRTGDVLLQLLVDLPDQLLALLTSVSCDCSSNSFSMSLLQ